MRKRTVLLTGCLAVALCLSLAVAASVLAPRLGADLASQAQEISQERTGLPLVFARPPVLSLLPFGLQFGAVSWGSKDSALSLTARGGFGSVSPLSLLRGNPALDELRIDGLRLVCRAAGRAAPALGAPAARATRSPGQADEHDQATPTATAPAPAPSLLTVLSPLSHRFPLRVDRIIISDGTASYVTAHGDRWDMADINLAYRRPGRSSIGDMLCDFTLRHRQVSGGLAEASVALQASGTLQRTTLAFSRCQLTVTPITGLYPREAGPVRLSLLGSVDLADATCRIDVGTISLPRANMDIRGRGSLAPAGFEGNVTLDAALDAVTRAATASGSFESLKLAGRATLRDGILRLPDFTASLDEQPVEGHFALGFSPLRVRADIHAARIDLDRLFPAALLSAQARAAAEKAGQPATTTPAATTKTAEERPGPSLRLDLTADTATFRGMPLFDLRTAIVGADGDYRAESIAFRTEGGGVVSASCDFNAPNGRWNSAGQAYSVPLNPVLRAVGLLPEGASMATERGSITAEWVLGASGTDIESLAESVSGNGRVVLRWVDTEAIRRALGSHEPWKALPPAIGRVKAPFTVSYGVGRWEADIAGDHLGGMGYGTFDNLARRLDARIFLDVLGVRLPLTLSGKPGQLTAAVDQKVLLGQLRASTSAPKEPGLSVAERTLLLPLLPPRERRQF